ncbi:MAG TPA: HD domain-containing phosphohydrolase [Gemmatimonadales bacterium]|nr:HD domain-containing phosphohydrolase [Gemmatimonadales bacterium]
MTALACPSSLPPLGVRRHAGALVQAARARERAGYAPEAIDGYQAAIAVAEQGGEHAVLAEALRRLAVLRHHRNDSAQARSLCRRSYEVARAMGDDLLMAEALNSLGCFDLATGSLRDARQAFLQALELGGERRDLCARVERNLGVLANIHGDLDEALARYSRSLEAAQSAGDEQGCALAYHNLGMVSADLEQWDEADRYFRRSYAIAERTGDLHLQGLCLVNHAAKVHVARQRFVDGQQHAEKALAIFDGLGARDEQSGAYRVIGIVYRETGHAAPAESRLRSAIDLAVAVGSVSNEAEASRELALLYQAMGRNREALALLTAAHRLFRRLDARRDLVHVGGKVAELEGTYLAVVSEWGQSIESNDSYTFGHCERVAQTAVAVAQAVGLDQAAQTTIRLGAYLHDVGKVKVPHEILNKPGPLTDQEVKLVQQHPIWGIELLAGVEFPWDLKPIIRWHHERYDGSGYPDRLRGEEIPLAAQIVGIADVYDALTTTRAYRPALQAAQALAEITRVQHGWSARVFAGFLGALPTLGCVEARQTAAHRAASGQAA